MNSIGTWPLWLATSVVAAVCMEGWAALLHGRIWHGFLWKVHRSHHRRRRGRFETNDVLSLAHVPLAVALILYGCVGAPGFARDFAFGWGLGMTAFGLLYLTFHDGVVHGRLPVAGLLRYRWVRLWYEAHLVHHRTGVGPYGFFYVPRAVRAAVAGQTERARALRAGGALTGSLDPSAGAPV